jgi:hypothetical protein
MVASTELPFIHVRLWPFGNFTRRDVQANLLDRVLLQGTKVNDLDESSAPALMVCMTDLTYALSIGAGKNGLFFVGPTTTRFFRYGSAVQFADLTRLAERVAVSGGFPGAFPALPFKAKITTVPTPVTESPHVEELSLMLADGGIRDNLGLRLLEAANERARNAPSEFTAWSGFSPGPEWKVDLILISDGGKFFEAAPATAGALGEIMRSVDISGLETGAFRPIELTDQLPKFMLSPLSLFALSPDAVIYGMRYDTLNKALHQYFRPALYSDDVLDELVSLVPDQKIAQARLRRYRALRTGEPMSLNKVREQCLTKPDAETPECAWWGLVSVVGDDIWHTLTVFTNKPTLDDSFTPDEAGSIFRFGQYMALLKFGEIDAALQSLTRRARLP